MHAPVWHTGALPRRFAVGDAPFAWVVRLDDPIVETMARQAPLRSSDLADLASRPQAGMRSLRRQLTKVLIALASGAHPDSISIERLPAGALRVTAPEGWHVSVAGHWPHAAIAIARCPLGVDIEPIGALPPPPDALTIGERHQLRHGTAQDALRRWTAKEAHAKAWGVAAQIDPAHIHTCVSGNQLTAMSREGRTLCDLANLGGLLAALARPVWCGRSNT
ncbi:phosphopantetheinyl transferase [Novosphingobium sp. 1529]|uniref:4'-phosphopantetheinyl transferase family protein n=1 Tax=unclassified Novosphingobium TaxID=2644732 RepID=UPI0003B44980|nr:4'-phosphopantetheinyl transferase family protein [Novosphingobium sp. B-7]KPF55813.1 hypothetical protein IP65_07350 [Novosphingobium sp. AAP1]